MNQTVIKLSYEDLEDLNSKLQARISDREDRIQNGLDLIFKLKRDLQKLHFEIENLKNEGK